MGAAPRAGVSPLGRHRPVDQDLLGVGLFVNAAREGVKPNIQAYTIEDTLRGGVKPYIQAYMLEDILRGEPSTESPAGAAGIMVSRGACGASGGVHVLKKGGYTQSGCTSSRTPPSR
jgi:hypothetical protein